MRTQIINTVNWRNYLIPNGNKRVEAFLESRGNEVFNQITLNVFQAIRNGKSKLVLIVHPNAGNAIVITKDEYSEFLEIASNWFLKTENYEMCGKIKKHRKIIHNTIQKIDKTFV